MKENIKVIVLKGLYQDNLTKLIDLCKQNLQEDPSLFFILESIFKSLEAEYDNQAITLERYNKVMTLLPIIISALEDPSKSNLDRLILAYNRL